MNVLWPIVVPGIYRKDKLVLVCYQEVRHNNTDSLYTSPSLYIVFGGICCPPIPIQKIKQTSSVQIQCYSIVLTYALVTSPV